jgi:hypothetical protein
VPECGRSVWQSEGQAITRAFRKSGRRLSEDEICAEARKRQKEMTEEEVALEKLKDLADKEAARKPATGQAGKVERAVVR